MPADDNARSNVASKMVTFRAPTTTVLVDDDGRRTTHPSIAYATDSASRPKRRCRRRRRPGPPQLVAPEVGPHHVGEVELGVGRLPEQEVRQPLLARGADHQVGRRQRARVERRARTSPSLIASGRRRPATAALRQPLRGPHQRLAPAVRQRQAQRHAAVRARRLGQRRQRPAHERRQALARRRSSSGGCRAPRSSARSSMHEPAQEPHQRPPPRPRAAPSSAPRTRTASGAGCRARARRARCRAHGLGALAVPVGRAAAAARRGPAAVAVHDDRDVVGKWFKRPPPLQKTPARGRAGRRSPRTVALRRRTVGAPA